MWVIQAGLRRGSVETYPLQNNGGVVLGRIFDRRHGEYGAPSHVAFDAAETRLLVGSAGQHLVDRYWGTYFAVLHDAAAAKYHVFRDPIGTLPCYHAKFKGLDIFFSHIEDCVRFLSISFAPNRRNLTRWLIFGGPVADDTGLDNVTSVPVGERLTLSHGHVARSRLWDPIAIAADARLEDPEKAAQALRSTVQNTIDAWASCYENVTHRLSGGLDSSIVAGCLAQAPSRPQINYLNLVIDMELDAQRMHLPGVDRRIADKLRAIAGHGDERYFARLVAERWQTALIERHRTLSMDMTRLWSVPLNVRPAMYFTAMEMDDVELELVKTRGTQAFFSGQAGDSVFLATQQPLPAIDYAYLHGLKPGLWEQVVATSKLSRESLWSVVGKAVRHGILRRPYSLPFSILSQPSLLKQELVGALTLEDLESDLSKRISHAALPPGKRDHLKGVTCSGYHDCIFSSGQYAEHIDPLNSQPVWEMMLQIPTCTLLTGGVSRGLARRAFADLLPAEIRKRVVKGTGSPFYQQLVKRNRDFLRERLLDGLLVQNDYLDRHRLEECLAAPDPSMTITPVSILGYLAAEVWLQQWAGHSKHTAAPATPALQSNATS
jgi:asparagine synthase (glutamine-hydrolysing)